MSTDNNESSNLMPIGKEISLFRSLLNCTQKSFSELMLVNRVTVSKIEQASEVDMISSDIAYRLFYVTQKVLDNQNKEDYIKLHAKNLQKRIDIILKNRIENDNQ